MIHSAAVGVPSDAKHQEAGDATPRLAGHCAAGEHFYCAGWSGAAPAGWQVESETTMLKTVWDAGPPEIDEAPDAVRLGQADVQQALELATLTKPGPFGPRTMELGMADSNHKVAIGVAVIGVAGTLGAALLANWDKVFGRPAQTSPAAVQVAPPAAPRVAASLTGNWRDSTGPNNTSRVRQVGNGFQFSRQGTLPDGTGFDAAGTGTVDGLQIASSYQARYGNGTVSSGTCSGTVSADATRMDLQCVDSLLGAFSSVAIRE